MAYQLTLFQTQSRSNSCNDNLINIRIQKDEFEPELKTLTLQSLDGSNSNTYSYPNGFNSAAEVSTVDGDIVYILSIIRERPDDLLNEIFARKSNQQSVQFLNVIAPIKWFLSNVITEENTSNTNDVTAILTKTNGNNLSTNEIGFLKFTYSLDGNTYSNNQPEGLTEGSYTLYAKDDFGCIKTRNFQVEASINYTLEQFNVNESSNPCNTVIVDMIIKRDSSDPTLDAIVLNEISGFFGEGYRYPQDFISTNSYEQNGFVFYEIELEKDRTQLLIHNVIVVPTNQVQKILDQRNIPVKWILEKINVNSIQPGTSTASGFLIKTNSQELTGAEKSAVGIQASLNGSDYGVNTIPGLEDGNYTYYVRDSFGCVQNLDFLVGDAIDENPEIFVSLLNSVRFAKRNNQIRNTENELSYEDQTDTNYKDWFNKYPVGQDLRFQYQSSYKDNEAYIIKDSNEVIKLNVVQLTDNRNVKDIRDGDILFNGTELFVSYPEGGNIYNEQGDVIGANRLNGSLLSYNEIGTFIEIEDIGVLKISNFKTLESGDEAMVFNYTSNQGAFSFTKKVTTTFTKQKLNYYEFQANGFTLGCYQIAICDSNNFDDQNPLESVKYLSERILITDDLEKHHQIKWSNSENNQIGWSTGITSEIYIPFVMPPTFEPEGENDVYSTDTRQFLLESEVFENYNFHLDLLPLAIARQVQLLLSNDNLLIDDLNYVKKETPEIEAKEGSNLYLVRPKLSRSTNYNSNSNLGQTINNNPSTIDGSKGILKLN